MLTIEEASNVIEGILFLSPSPVKADDLAKNLLIDLSLVEAAIKKLSARHEDGGLEILKTAGGWEFATRRDYVDHLRSFFGKMDRTKLSRAALEALSIVAYKQPITRADLEAIRGVNSSGVLRSLLDWGLISISGKAEGIGRPYLFSTTAEFLRYMGLDSLADLPPLETFSKKF